MTTSATYLEAKVLGASPYQLRLMLIEGAIRFGRQAELGLEQGDFSDAFTPLSRVIDILGEILASVRSGKSELNKRLASFYIYLFHTVCEARVNSDAVKLRDALNLLEYERETWQLVCVKLSAGRNVAPPRSASPRLSLEA